MPCLRVLQARPAASAPFRAPWVTLVRVSDCRLLVALHPITSLSFLVDCPTLTRLHPPHNPAEQKWSKGKSRDKLANKVLFDKETLEKFNKEVPSYKIITPAVVSDRMKIRGSLARAAIKDLESEGKIRCVVQHSKMMIYTRATMAE